MWMIFGQIHHVFQWDRWKKEARTAGEQRHKHSHRTRYGRSPFNQTCLKFADKTRWYPMSNWDQLKHSVGVVGYFTFPATRWRLKPTLRHLEGFLDWFSLRWTPWPKTLDVWDFLQTPRVRWLSTLFSGCPSFRELLEKAQTSTIEIFLRYCILSNCQHLPSSCEDAWGSTHLYSIYTCYIWIQVSMVPELSQDWWPEVARAVGWAVAAEKSAVSQRGAVRGWASEDLMDHEVTSRVASPSGTPYFFQFHEATQRESNMIQVKKNHWTPL